MPETDPSWRLSAQTDHSKNSGVSWDLAVLFDWGVRKIGKLQRSTSKQAEETIKMRFEEPRRFQSRQKGGSGLPKELPRLPPKATMDIGGTAFGSLGGESIKIWMQHVLQTDPSWRSCTEPRT